MRKKGYFVFGIIIIVLGILSLLPGLLLIWGNIKDGYFITALSIFLVIGGIWFIRKSKTVEIPASPVQPVPENPVFLSQNPPLPIKWDFDVNVKDNEEDPGSFIYHSCKTTDNNLNLLRKSFIVLDTETTGLSNADRICSIGAIRFVNMASVDSFYTLVNPLMHIPEAASRVNHIYDADVADAPLEGEMLKMLDNYLGNSTDIIVGYNISFDMRFLQRAAARNNYEREVRTYDVMTLSKREIKELKNYKQVTVAKHLGINTDKAHNSLGDCEICAQILIRLLNK